MFRLNKRCNFYDENTHVACSDPPNPGFSQWHRTTRNKNRVGGLALDWSRGWRKRKRHVSSGWWCNDRSWWYKWKSRIPKDDPDNPTHSFTLRKLSWWNPYRAFTTSPAFCAYKFPHRCESIRLVTVSRRHAIFRSNTVDDIIRYIKTLLTRQCFPRVHRRESDVACNSVCFSVTQHCRDVDGVYVIFSSVYVHKRDSSPQRKSTYLSWKYSKNVRI